MLSYVLIAIVVGSSLGGVLWQLGEFKIFTKPVLEPFSSYQELVDFVKKGPQDAPQSLLQKVLSLFQESTRSPQGMFVTFTADEGGRSQDLEYSTTNIQVEGVDEADMVKTDGTYLYLVSGSVVYIIQAYPPEDAQVLSKLDLGSSISGLFINDDKLVIFQQGFPGNGNGAEVYYRAERLSTSILVYDISERSSPIFEANQTVSGVYFSSRMIGDYVYAVVNEPISLINESTLLLPEILVGDNVLTIEATQIYHTEEPDAYDLFTTIVALNIQEPEVEPTVETFLLGATSCLYVSKDHIYLTSSTYSTPSTNIHKIRIGGGEINYISGGAVPGYVLNQFSMDENDGFFRIATSNGMVNNVYILDEKLEVRGGLEGLAPGESIYSARFQGDRCYLVTFRKVDPLFVIDLTDPENPEVLGKLKIPGYSDYLHPYDETHLIGIGKETLSAEGDDFSWYQGVKISLFDVSNVSKPMEVAKYEIGDRGTDSPVLQDHKAFLFSKSMDLLALPILLAEIDESKYPSGVPPYIHGEYVYQGAYIFNITINGIVLKGRVTHIDDLADFMMSGYYYFSSYAVKRSLYINQVLYTMSDKRVKLNSLETLDEIKVVELA